MTPTTIQAHIVRQSEDGTWLFLVLQRAKTETVMPELWQVVTGVIQDDETAVQAAFREIQEETGLPISMLWVIPFVGSYFDAVQNTFVFIPCFGAITTSDAVQLSHEHQNFLWLPLEETLALLPLPSHIQGTEVFFHTILNTQQKPPTARYMP